MTLVYRVENENGTGVYSCGGHYMFEKEKHPPPTADSKLINEIGKANYRSVSISGNFIFGFASLEQLKSWIYQDEWRKHIDDKGFKISVYECEEAYCGDTQAVIKTDKQRTLLYKLSLLEI